MKWIEVVKKFPEANFLQSPEYGRMNEILGEKVFTVDIQGKAYYLAIVRDAKRGRYLEIPCGPLMDWGDAALISATLESIKKLAKRENCVFARMRPQILNTPENLRLLERAGLRKSPMHLAAEHTVMLDLTKSEDMLLSEMRRQTRYEVRRAGKLGITVTHDNSKEIFEEFQKVQAATARRQNFVPPSLRTLLAEREAFYDKAEIYVARNDAGEAIAYGLIIRDVNEAAYYEAASTDLNRKLPGAYALLWQAMRDLKKAGILRFNLWGIAPAGQPNHRYAGVTTFKTGFGGEIVEFVPAHDMVISGARYLPDLMFEKLRKKRRHL